MMSVLCGAGTLYYFFIITAGEIWGTAREWRAGKKKTEREKKINKYGSRYVARPRLLCTTAYVCVYTYIIRT